MTSAARVLCDLVSKGQLASAPGAPDPFTARLVEKAGFDAVYMTGLGATAMRLGSPDLGLMTQTEMADHARAMVRAVGIPVIADADTGYGGALNVARTVEEYMQGGVAALHLEDQVTPKRCGQLAGIRLVEADLAEKRVKAALRQRGAGDMMIIARTDALPGEGMDEAVSRASRYRDAGADLVFVDGVKTIAHVEEIARRVEGPKVVSLVDGTEAASLTRAQIADMGFSLVLYAVTTLFAAACASTAALETLRETGATPKEGSMSYSDFCDVVDLKGHQLFADEFGG
ncbi:isocitrate lyase/PEP mutase family protein [Rhodobacterales bacterium]|nr:isocitrate lyase/PEP mutase family protein [Rhodobacterales bacterium]